MSTSRLAPLVLLTALLATGCTGDDDGPTSEPTPSDATTSPSVGGSLLGGSPLGDTPSDLDLGVPPTTYDEGEGHLSAAVAAGEARQEIARFVTPTGNIYCVITDLAAVPACEIGEGGTPDPDVCDPEGPSRVVGRLELGADGPVPVCNTDTIRGGDAPVLEYGGVASWPSTSIECVVEQIGVTCLDVSQRRGFFLARGRYRLLG